MALEFAVAIPQFIPDGAFDPARFRAYLMRAEALGFGSAWALEQVFGSTPALGPVETMTYAAAVTDRIRLGCVVFVTPLHNPVHLAKSLSTLDQLSRGRLDVGVAIGGQGRMFSAFEVDPTHLVSRFNEGLRLMQALWTEPTVNFEGRFWQVQGAEMEPKPFQKPHPPIWFGANRPAALRRAVKHGYGFFGAGSTTTERFAEQVKTVRAELAAADRNPATLRIAKRIYIAVDDDAERAHQTVSDGLHRLYAQVGLREIVRVAVFGTPEMCAAGVRAVADAGAELILFTPFVDQDEQMERLAAEVMPRVAG
jgi:probable F420-dependent oxidoreductase